MEVAGQEQHLQELHEADSPVNRSAMFRHCTGQAPTIAQTTAVYATTVNQGLSMRAETGTHESFMKRTNKEREQCKLQAIMPGLL